MSIVSVSMTVTTTLTSLMNHKALDFQKYAVILEVSKHYFKVSQTDHLTIPSCSFLIPIQFNNCELDNCGSGITEQICLTYPNPS